MEDTRHVLLVTNSATDNEIFLIQQAMQQAQEHNIKIQLSLVNVIPHLPTCYFNIPSMVLVAEQYYEDAKKCLLGIGNTLNVDKKDQWLMVGRIKTEVLRLANKLNPNFILANSAHIQDLNRSFLFRRPPQFALKQLNNIGSL